MSSTIYLNTINKSSKKLFTTNDLKLLLQIESSRTLEDLIKRLTEEKILTQLEKGKYKITDVETSSFEIAQFLYSPSYISFETALNYHGILSQFPIEITSATTKKRTNKNVLDVTYSYSKIDTKLFTGYYKEDNFLIAYPEKALFDQFYMISKNLKTKEYLNEMDYSQIKNKNIEKYLELVGTNSQKQIQELIQKYL